MCNAQNHILKHNTTYLGFNSSIDKFRENRAITDNKRLITGIMFIIRHFKKNQLTKRQFLKQRSM